MSQFSLLIKKFNNTKFLIKDFYELQNPQTKVEAHVGSQERQHREEIKVDIADSSGGHIWVQVNDNLQFLPVRSGHWTWPISAKQIILLSSHPV